MSVNDVIKVRMDRLKTLDPDKDFNNNLFNAALAVLIFGGVAAYKHGFHWFLLGLLIYSFMAYKSVNWEGKRRGR